MSFGPRAAAWTLGALTAVALGGSVYRVPIQVSDSLTTSSFSGIATYLAARFPPPASCDGVPLPW